MERDLQQKNREGVIRIVMFGPESTGKTTLAKALAKYYHTEWVPEFARDFLQDKIDRGEGICTFEDLMPIAEGQMQLENDLLQKANKVLFCDTDLLETMVYSEVYYDLTDKSLEKSALENQYDLYILTGIDVPWVADDLRDKPDEREEMYNYFKETLIHYDRPFITVKGDEESRLNQVIPLIDALIARVS